MDTSPYNGSHSQLEREVVQALQPALESLYGRESRKAVIENSDVCLLAGLITKAIQQNRAGG